MSAKHVRQSAIFVQRKMYKYKTINEAPPSSLDLDLLISALGKDIMMDLLLVGCHTSSFFTFCNYCRSN